MRVAIASDGNKIAQKFDKSNILTIFENNNGRIKGKINIDVSASGGEDALLYILGNEGAEVLLCGTISPEAKMDLEESGIEVISELRGNTSSVINAYLRSKTKSIRPKS